VAQIEEMAFTADPIKYNNEPFDLDDLLWEKGKIEHDQARMAYVEDQIESVDNRIKEHAQLMGEKNAKKFKSGFDHAAFAKKQQQ